MKGMSTMYRTAPVDKIRYKQNNLTDRLIGKLYVFFMEIYAGYILPLE